MMIIVNFSHPLTEEQCGQIEGLGYQPIDRIIDVPVQLDHERPFADQVAELVAGVGLTSQEWQTAPLLINPPSFAPGAVVLLAWLHGVMGHFPTVTRIRPVTVGVTSRFVVEEVINLQRVRELARSTRHGGVCGDA